jgi:hypothetical protein
LEGFGETNNFLKKRCKESKTRKNGDKERILKEESGYGENEMDPDLLLGERRAVLIPRSPHGELGAVPLF